MSEQGCKKDTVDYVVLVGDYEEGIIDYVVLVDPTPKEIAEVLNEKLSAGKKLIMQREFKDDNHDAVTTLCLYFVATGL